MLGEAFEERQRFVPRPPDDRFSVYPKDERIHARALLPEAVFDVFWGIHESSRIVVQRAIERSGLDVERTRDVHDLFFFVGVDEFEIVIKKISEFRQWIQIDPKVRPRILLLRHIVPLVPLVVRKSLSFYRRAFGECHLRFSLPLGLPR